MKIWSVIVEVAWEVVEEMWYDIIFFEQNMMFFVEGITKAIWIYKIVLCTKVKILKFDATFVLIIFCVQDVLLSKL